MTIRFEPVTVGDYPLVHRMLSDPGMMQHLGGVLDDARIRESHQNQLNATEQGGWCFKVMPDDAKVSGTVMIWSSEWEGSPIHEMGWMTLPEWQGQGVTTRAVIALLDRVAMESAFAAVHAFPAVSNVASNRICEKAGFEHEGVCSIRFKDRPLDCNHWVWSCEPGS